MLDYIELSGNTLLIAVASLKWYDLLSTSFTLLGSDFTLGCGLACETRRRDGTTGWCLRVLIVFSLTCRNS